MMPLFFIAIVYFACVMILSMGRKHSGEEAEAG